MEASNVLANHMHPPGTMCPIALVVSAIVGIPKRGDIVAQRVEPDIRHLLGVARHANATAARAGTRARDAEIGQAAANEAEHLILARLWHNPQPIALDQLAQAIGIARK